MVKNNLLSEDSEIIINKIKGTETLKGTETVQSTDTVKKVEDTDIDTGTDTNIIDIKSKSVFITQAISGALIRELKNPDIIFTYFVNKIEHGKIRTPYSFVTGSKKMTTAYDLKENEIIVNKWLADDLKIVLLM